MAMNPSFFVTSLYIPRNCDLEKAGIHASAPVRAPRRYVEPGRVDPADPFAAEAAVFAVVQDLLTGDLLFRLARHALEKADLVAGQRGEDDDVAPIVVIQLVAVAVHLGVTEEDLRL